MTKKLKFAVFFGIIAIILFVITLLLIFPPNWLINMIGEEVAERTSSAMGLWKIGDIVGGTMGRFAAEKMVPTILREFSWYFGIGSLVFIFLTSLIIVTDYIKKRKKYK